MKGDLANLLLAFGDLSAASLEPWLEVPPNEPRSAAELAAEAAEQRRAGLAKANIGEPELADFRARTSFRVITPGTSAV